MRACFAPAAEHDVAAAEQRLGVRLPPSYRNFLILERLVLISNDDGGAGHYLMLDSGEVAENGEWAAYEWWPGDGDDPEPYENFAVLVTDLWRNTG